MRESTSSCLQWLTGCVAAGIASFGRQPCRRRIRRCTLRRYARFPAVTLKTRPVAQRVMTPHRHRGTSGRSPRRPCLEGAGLSRLSRLERAPLEAPELRVPSHISLSSRLRSPACHPGTVSSLCAQIRRGSLSHRLEHGGRAHAASTSSNRRDPCEACSRSTALAAVSAIG